MSEAYRIWAFTIYSIFYEAIIWGIFGYGVFWLNHSGWWFLLAFALSGAQLKPRHFGFQALKKEADG